jgi:hypothetical protein
MRRTTSIAIVLIPLLAVIPSRTQTKDIGDIDAVKQVEQTMGSAMVAGDINTLSQIYADNFATIGSDGKLYTKKDLLTDFDSFHDKLEWFENGPIDVQVFGDVALAQGSVKEKRSRNGKDTSGQFLWQDVLQRRAGKWVVWRTAAARVVLADAPNAQSQDPAVVAAIMQWWPATLRKSIRPTPTIGQPSHPPARSSPRKGFYKISNQAITNSWRLKMDP